MTTGQLLEEKAESLARSGTATDEAVNQLLEVSGTKRVSVVVAQQHFLERLEENSEDELARRAAELLDEALARGEWPIEEGGG